MYCTSHKEKYGIKHKFLREVVRLICQRKKEEKKLAEDIDYISKKEDIPAAETKAQISSGTVSTSLKTRRDKKHSTWQKNATDEENRADDIEYMYVSRI